jgi:hypothetical protein
MCDCFSFFIPLENPYYTLTEYYVCVDACKACTRLHLAIDMRGKPQEVGGTLIGEDGWSGMVSNTSKTWLPFATFHPLM